MNKIVIVAGCLLGLALVWVPAYASPTSKKVTITCNSATGASVTGTADVYLCSSIDTSATAPANECVGATQCPSDFTCDSTGTISITMPCVALSKVGGVYVSIGCMDGNDSCGTTHISTLKGGKGVDLSAGSTDGDGVTVTVK